MVRLEGVIGENVQRNLQDLTKARSFYFAAKIYASQNYGAFKMLVSSVSIRLGATFGPGIFSHIAFYHGLHALGFGLALVNAAL